MTDRETRTHAHPKRWQAKNGLSRGSSAGPSAAHGNPRTSGAKPVFLPQWAQSAFSRINGKQGGQDINTSMQSLNHIHSMLSSLVPGIKRQKTVHMSRTIFCPSLACKGIIHVHEGNGTFVALDDKEETLYARCSDRSCVCSEEDTERGYMDVIKKTGPRPWVKLTAEILESIEENISSKKLKRT